MLPTYRYKVSHNGIYIFHVWDTTPHRATEAAREYMKARYMAAHNSASLVVELDPNP